MRNVCRLVAGVVAGMVAMQGASAQPYLGVGIASLSLTRSNELSASAMYVFR